MKARIVSLLVVILMYDVLHAAIPPACGNWPSKPAWEWTLDERLEHRFEVQCLEARRVEAGRQDRHDGTCRSSGQIADFVFGTDTPELLLPWELFGHLVGTAFLADEDFRGRRRHVFLKHAKGLDVPSDFWEIIEKTAGDYIQLLREQRTLASGLETATSPERRGLLAKIEEAQKPNCQIRAAALDRLQQVFPEQLFMKFLYVAVAPGLCVSGNSAESKTNHQWIATGCSSPTE